MRCQAQQLPAGGAPIGELKSGDAMVHGAVVVVAGGAQVMSGSQVTAGASAATLKLRRGGSVRVCPGTNVTLAASKSGDELLLGMDSGGIEAHYDVGAVTDTVMTPDLRLALTGPGSFQLAVSVSLKGDACVESLPGNTAAVIVSETLGDGTYQVRPGERLIFKGGSVKQIAAPESPCGCPAPKAAAQFAEISPTMAAAAESPSSTDAGALKFPEEQSREAQVKAARGELGNPVLSNVGGNQLKIDTSMAFRADSVPAPPATADSLRRPNMMFPEFPPPRVAFVKPAKPRKWYQRIAAFFTGKKG